MMEGACLQDVAGADWRPVLQVRRIPCDRTLQGRRGEGLKCASSFEARSQAPSVQAPANVARSQTAHK
jgi:hypothetical protein